jgi:type I restriction enzyme M protein
MDEVTFLNPFTCGIYKDGALRYKIDPATGRRTDEIDNQLGQHVNEFLSTGDAPGAVRVPLEDTFSKRVLVPRYYDDRWQSDFNRWIAQENLESVSLGDLASEGVILIRGGHGSPSNDNRSGHIPYIKVSDIRSLRINVNPTNLVTKAVAEKFWKGSESGLEPWDLVTPNRASSNIGEFAIA